MKFCIAFLTCLPLLFLAACNETPKTVPEPVKKDTTPRIPLDSAQTINNVVYPGVDVSPMDMTYFPVDYPKLKMANGTRQPPLIRIIYSRPHLQHRKLFHDILKYDEKWRLGANESTEIDLYKAATIQKHKIAPGRYIIYCIPHHDSWTIVLNSNIDTWGLKQDTTKDVQKFEIPISTGNPVLQYFTMVFEKTDTGADLVIAWEDVVARLPIEFN